MAASIGERLALSEDLSSPFTACCFSWFWLLALVLVFVLFFVLLAQIDTLSALDGWMDGGWWVYEVTGLSLCGH